MARLLCLLLCVFPIGAKAADEIWATLSLHSYHSKRHTYNENNLGAGLEYSSSSFPQGTRLVTGFYDNSFNRETVYAGVSYTPLTFGNFHFGGLAVGVTNYPNTSFLGAFALEYEHKKIGVNLFFVPRVLPHKFDTAVAALQLKFLF